MSDEHGDVIVGDVASGGAAAASWDDVAKQHMTIQQTVRIPMRADLLDIVDQLELQARREQEIDKRENREPVAPQVAEQIQRLEEDLAASEVEFTFVGIGRRRYKNLITEHPPTAEQQAEADEPLSYNPETFPPALLAESCTSPVGATVESMTDVWENWSIGQSAQLWQTCLRANTAGAGPSPKSQIASVILDGSAKS